MVNVFRMVREAKAKAMKFKDKKEQQKAIKVANELADLKKRRIALESRDKLYKIKEKEQDRLNKAKQNLRKRTPAYRVVHALKDNLKKNKGRSLTNFGNLPGQNFQSSSSGGLFNSPFMKEQPKRKLKKR